MNFRKLRPAVMLTHNNIDLSFQGAGSCPRADPIPTDRTYTEELKPRSLHTRSTEANGFDGTARLGRTGRREEDALSGGLGGLERFKTSETATLAASRSVGPPCYERMNLWSPALFPWTFNPMHASHVHTTIIPFE